MKISSQHSSIPTPNRYRSREFIDRAVELYEKPYSSAVLHGVFPYGFDAISWMEQGSVSATFGISDGVRRRIVKVVPDDGYYQAEVGGMKLAAEHRLLVPLMVAYGVDEVLDLNMIVYHHVNHPTLLRLLDVTAVEKAWPHYIAQSAASFHSVMLPHTGTVSVDGQVLYEPYRDLLTKRYKMQESLLYLLTNGLLPLSVIDRIRQSFDELADPPRAVLNHGDIHPANIFFEERIHTVMPFDLYACAAEPEMDLACLGNWCQLHSRDHEWRKFLKEYESIKPLNRESLAYNQAMQLVSYMYRYHFVPGYKKQFAKSVKLFWRSWNNLSL